MISELCAEAKEILKNLWQAFQMEEISEEDYIELRNAVLLDVAEQAELEAAVRKAKEKLRSTTLNWQEQCLFDCDEILTAALDRGK